MSASHPPKLEDGKYDREAVKGMYMASKFIDWTRFAEDLHWDPLLTRREFPVREWQKLKRDNLATNQMDTLSAMFYERRFQWSEDVFKTLNEYPKLIDLGMEAAKWKLTQIGHWAKDYFENFHGKDDKMFKTTANGKKMRIFHPFEKLSPVEISAMLRGLESITQAKLKALMLDKWAISKFDMPLDQPPTEGEEGQAISGPTFTVEGKGEVNNEDFQRWMDEYLDKPGTGVNGNIPPAPMKDPNELPDADDVKIDG